MSLKEIKKGKRERKNSVLKKKSKYKKCKLRRHTGEKKVERQNKQKQNCRLKGKDQ